MNVSRGRDGCVAWILFIAVLTSNVSAQEWVYTVKPGDNLWDLAEKYLVGMRYWRPLQALNNVTQPNKMRLGEKLRVPIRWMRVLPSKARVVSVSGDVQIITGKTKKSQPATLNASLDAGDTLVTGKGSNVTLRFADGSQLVLREQGELVMETLKSYGDSGMVDTRLRLKNGRTENKVKPSKGPGSRHEIKSPSATAAVRGTQYRVGYDASSSVAVAEVLSGKVVVIADKRTIDVVAGFGSAAQLNESPIVPVKLLPPPVLSSLPAKLDRVPIVFQLETLPGTHGHRVQIADNEGFESLLFDTTVSTSTIRGPDIPDGRYYLRVRAIDEIGLEGFDSTHAFILNARPEPPLPMAPRQEAAILNERPVFRWSEALKPISEYRFQLARDQAFAELITDSAPKDTSLALDQTLDPGDYFWRVASVASGDQGPYGDPQRFRRPMPAPQADKPVMDENQLTLSWRAGQAGVRYQLQMASDETFKKILVDQLLDEAQITLPRPKPDSYYVRIKNIEPDGFEGPYGAVQKVKVPGSPWGILLGLIPLLVVLLI